MKTVNLILLAIICFLIGCNLSKQTKPCSQCPQYSEQVKEIKVLESEQLELLETTELMGIQIDDLMEENQIFASMLSEIENEPGGHEILTKLYNEKNNF